MRMITTILLLAINVLLSSLTVASASTTDCSKLGTHCGADSVDSTLHITSFTRMDHIDLNTFKHGGHKVAHPYAGDPAFKTTNDVGIGSAHAGSIPVGVATNPTQYDYTNSNSTQILSAEAIPDIVTAPGTAPP